MNTLILLTRRFPYFKTESFLESEIDILATYFDKIVIYPSEISDEKRTIPINVKVNTELSVEYRKKFKRAITTFFNLFFWSTLFKHLKDIKSLSDLFWIFKYSSSVVTYEKFFLKEKTLTCDNLLVYSYWFNSAVHAMINVKEREGLNYKIVARAHRYDIYENLPSTHPFWPKRGEILNSIEQVFSISTNGKDYLDTKYKYPHKTSVSRLGVFDKGGIVKEKVERDTITIVSVSRIESLKRVDLICKTVAKFAEVTDVSKVRWVHFGDGSKKRDVINSIVQHKNLKIELMGAVRNEVIYEFYQNEFVDLFINLSMSEGIPVSIMEAQSFGIPVLATDVGGTSEIVNNFNGKLISCHMQIDNIVMSITEVLQMNLNPRTLKEMWSKNYDAEKNYNNLSKSLVDLLESKNL